MKTKLEKALEKAADCDVEFEIQHTISMFYNLHLMKMIELDQEHDFLSTIEKKCLKKLALILEERIMEDLSIVRTVGTTPYGTEES